MSAPPELVMLQDAYPSRMARLASLVLVDFKDLAPEVDGDPNEMLIAALDDAAAHGGDVVLFARIRNTRPPPASSRQQILSKVHELKNQLGGIIVSLEDSGFRGAAFRSFVSAAKMMRLFKAPAELFGEFEPALLALDELAKLDVESRGIVRSFFALAP